MSTLTSIVIKQENLGDAAMESNCTAIPRDAVPSQELGALTIVGVHRDGNFGRDKWVRRNTGTKGTNWTFS